MSQSDFIWVNVDEAFSDTNTAAHRTFYVDGNPSGTAFLLIQIKDVDLPNPQSISAHRLVINGVQLPSFDLPIQEGNNRWTTWMDRIPHGILNSGPNRLSIFRVGGQDNFTVANVAINWRENLAIFEGPNSFRRSEF